MVGELGMAAVGGWRNDLTERHEIRKYMKGRKSLGQEDSPRSPALQYPLISS
jgi:hypothetical protein